MGLWTAHSGTNLDSPAKSLKTKLIFEPQPTKLEKEVHFKPKSLPAKMEDLNRNQNLNPKLHITLTG